MIGLYGIIKKDLDRQGKLPVKYYDEIPSSPVTSGCILYADALNNNGGSHSNNPSKWIPIIGSTRGTKVGSPIWHDDCLECTNEGYYFQKLTSVSEFTYEAVFQLLTDNTYRLLSDTQDNGASLYSITQPLSFGAWNKSINDYYVVANLSKPRSYYVGKKCYVCGRVGSEGIKLYNSITNSTVHNAEVTSCDSRGSVPFAIGYEPTTNGNIQTTTVYKANLYVYSVRVYNRSITDEEMKQNMLYDRARYNF